MVYFVDRTTPTPYPRTHTHTSTHTHTHPSTIPSADSHNSPTLLYTYFGNLPYLPIPYLLPLYPRLPPSTPLFTCTHLYPPLHLYRYSAPGSQRCSNCPAGAACPKDGFFNASLPGGGVTVCQAGCVEERGREECERNARESEKNTKRGKRGVTGCASISKHVSSSQVFLLTQIPPLPPPPFSPPFAPPFSKGTSLIPDLRPAPGAT
jgi:hypothetical protein